MFSRHRDTRRASLSLALCLYVPVAAAGPTSLLDPAAGRTPLTLPLPEGSSVGPADARSHSPFSLPVENFFILAATLQT
jgi:hypothetical protein